MGIDWAEYEDRPVPLIDVMERWPHQVYAVEAAKERIEAGCRTLLVTTPTGGGKSLEIADLARWAARSRAGASIFTHRKLLIQQFKEKFNELGLDFGLRADGYRADAGMSMQIASVQTEYSRVVKRGMWNASDSDLVLVDEAHLHNNKRSRRVFKEYTDKGAVLVGFTATPLGLSDQYTELIVAGTMSELRECGALVEATHHGCDEPGLADIRRIPVGEIITEKQQRKLIMTPGIHGRVIDNFRLLNPKGLASIGFAPGVAESRGFAEAFEEAGIPSAHIDGDYVWIRGHERRSTEDSRNELFRMSRTGEVRIVWNRFVLREAIDMPWLLHCVLATVFGDLKAYLQAVGRSLRACHPVHKRGVTIQDHGGNWWRWGSVNDDRHWRLTDTAAAVANERADNISGTDQTPPKEPEPFRCPKCQTILVLRELLKLSTMVECYKCGKVFDFSSRSRPVIQTDGRLIEHPGQIFRPKRTERRPDTLDLWKKCYWMAKNSGKTFNAAAGWFYSQHGYMPPRHLPMMPRTTYEWYLPVKDVAFDRLRSAAEDEA